MDGSIPMFQLAAMIGKARDGTPEPPDRPETPSIYRDFLDGYRVTPPRYWWKNEPTPPRRHPRKYMEDDSDFTYDFSRTISTPDVTIQTHCSPGIQQARLNELQRQVKAIKEALGMKTPPAGPSPTPARSPSPPPQNVTFVDEDGNTLDCQDGPAPPRPAPSSCRKVPRSLPQATGLYTTPLPSLLTVHSASSSPPVVTAQSSQPSSSSWGKLGLVAAAGVTAFALGFAARWMMS
jgi:hypothetical protein